MLGLYWGYSGIMEKKMETTIICWGHNFYESTYGSFSKSSGLKELTDVGNSILMGRSFLGILDTGFRV